MLNTHYGTLGNNGKFLKWEKNNPREFLMKLREANPSLDDESLLDLFRDSVLLDENREYLLTLIDYFFVNASRSWRELCAEEDSIEVKQKKKEERRHVIASAKEELLDNAKNLLLMDLLLPHGKTLSHSTGGECAMIGPRVGSWLAKIGKEVPAGKLVGKVLTEKKVREIYASV